MYFPFIFDVNYDLTKEQNELKGDDRPTASVNSYNSDKSMNIFWLHCEFLTDLTVL